MVVLAASVCTKAGKPLVARHFVDMPRARIEGLLASFPKLIGSSDQHTFVETDAVRYVYQPLEDLYLVLITNKQSNILQDIDSLHLFSRIVSETCRSKVDEREVSRNAFELINVFDEVVSVGGYKESVNLGHVRTIVEMESHEERIQEEIERNKEREAKEELARKAKLMDAQRREMAKRGGAGGGGFGGAGGFGGSGGPGSNANYGGFKSGGGGGGGAGGFDSTPKPFAESTPSYASAPASRPLGGGKGMQLGKKQNATDAIFDTIKKDEGLVDNRDRNASASRGGAVAPVSNVRQEGVHIVIDERISARVSRDGGLESMEVKGKMELKVTDPSKAHFRVALQNAYNDTIQFTTHPNVDKTLFATGVIGLRDATRPFPVNQVLPLVKWRFLTKDDSLLPLSINCWPSPSGNGTCDVNIEYELQLDRLELRDVVVSVPYPGSTDPIIQSADGHSYQINRSARTIEWQLPLIDSSNKNGVLEFTVSDENVDGFFPIKVSFTSLKPYCSVNVGDVLSMDGSQTRVAFSQDVSLLTEEYVIVCL
ncbi:UNVERIFIED_CONTAM: Coatomer subunit delta [Siphonaria sp. JEL0065]|nr:Coatomer subunit delta [Siphonaria sp. JEL0065]